MRGGWRVCSGRAGAATGEDVADAVCQRVEAERRDAEEALGNNQQFFAQDLQLQLLSQKRRREVRRGGHQQNQVLQPLVAHSPNVFQLITLFDEAESFLNFPPRQVDLCDPP